MPISLVHDDQRVNGIIVMDMINGNLISIQCKALIIADQGAQNIFTDGSVGLGLGLVADAGLPLCDMEFFSSTPLGIKDTNLILPTTILADGAEILESDGSAIEYDTAGGIGALFAMPFLTLKIQFWMQEILVLNLYGGLQNLKESNLDVELIYPNKPSLLKIELT